MIVITGARGFIASRLVESLNSKGYTDLILVDENENPKKESNLCDANFKEFIHRNQFLAWFENNATYIHFVFHLGARTDTTEQDQEIFKRLNLNYSKAIFNTCTLAKIPLVYASSAATYGNGEHGYSDEVNLSLLEALNPYGQSKHDFDIWVEQQEKRPPFWAGLKFFNVYGGNESHKARMASVVLHAFRQIKETGKMKLFQSHNDNYKNGEQLRDFIYVNDVVNICLFFFTNQNSSGLYNVGTGKARSFNDLVNSVFRSLELTPQIEYIPTPIDIREAYQYFTEADTHKLRAAGYKERFTTLEDGVNDYIKNHLSK